MDTVGSYSKVSFDAIDFCSHSVDDVLAVFQKKRFGQFDGVDLLNLLPMNDRTTSFRHDVRDVPREVGERPPSPDRIERSLGRRCPLQL